MNDVAFAEVKNFTILPFGADEPVTFLDVAESAEWLKAQLSAWSPFHSHRALSMPLMRAHKQILAVAMAAVEDVKKSSANNKAENEKKAIEALRRIEQLPYLSSDGVGGREVLAALRSSVNTAYIIFSLWQNDPVSNVRDYNDLDIVALLRSAAVWKTADHGYSDEAARQRRSISVALGKWESDFKVLQDRAHAFVDHASNETADALSRQADVTTSLTSLYSDAHQRLTALEAEHGQALSDLYAQRGTELEALHEERSGELYKLEETFREHMRLKAPADYWTQKALKHKKMSRVWLAGLLFLLVMGVALSLALYSKYMFSWLDHLASQNVSAAAAVLFSLPALLYATLVRVAHRSYRDEVRHANDAEQRSTLVQTYLALTHESETGIQPGERLLALHALFRGSAQADSPDDTPPINALEAILHSIKPKN